MLVNSLTANSTGGHSHVADQFNWQLPNEGHPGNRVALLYLFHQRKSQIKILNFT